MNKTSVSVFFAIGALGFTTAHAEVTFIADRATLSAIPVPQQTIDFEQFPEGPMCVPVSPYIPDPCVLLTKGVTFTSRLGQPIFPNTRPNLSIDSHTGSPLSKTLGLGLMPRDRNGSTIDFTGKILALDVIGPDTFPAADMAIAVLETDGTWTELSLPYSMGAGAFFGVRSSIGFVRAAIFCRPEAILCAARMVDNLTTETQVFDDRPPTSAPIPTPAANAAGWNNSDVTVSWNWADGPEGSGIDAANCVASTKSSGEGTIPLTGTCKDLAGNQATSNWTVQVDKTPPSCTVRATPSTLWSPNHKLVKISTSVTVTDALSGSGGFRLVSVTSSEPKGSSADIRGWSIGASDVSGFLRAERKSKRGRTYTITYSGSDKAGNETLCSAVVSVPHDQGDDD